MKAHYALVADVIVVTHLFYVLFAVGGEIVILVGAIFGWKGIRNPLFRISHLVAVGLVAVEAATGINCPLTAWEYDLRQLTSQAVEKNLSFIARLVRLIIFYNFPSWVFTVMHIAFGLLVVFTYILIPPQFQRKQ
ncbi:MAG TPA: DUF2784 domain-containing protein [Syntrophorhabdaceae bacterium]|nr:DUF2784 domain-containing protein [Syntrophorhabdaceae bacterium]